MTDLTWRLASIPFAPVIAWAPNPIGRLSAWGTCC